MLLAGTYTASTEYLIQIMSTKTNQRWTLFSPVAIEDLDNLQEQKPLQNAVITIEDISSAGATTRGGSKYSKYVLTSMIMTHSGKLMSYYGNTVLLNPLLRELTSSGMMHEIIEVLRGGLETDPGSIKQRYTLETGSVLDITQANRFYKSGSKIPGLEYQDAGMFVNESLEQVTRMTKLRTWEQIRAEKGDSLAWLYDEYGREKKDYRIINTPEGFEWLVSELSKPEYKVVAWDTETTGLDMFYMRDVPEKRDKICGMSLTWKADQGVYIPFLSEKFDTLDVQKTLDALVPIMHTKVLAAHNGLFDMRVFKSLGKYVVTAIDTMLLEFLFDPYVSKGSKGLKLVTRKYFGHETLELDDILGGVVDATLIPFLDYDVIRVYGCSDTDYVFKLVQLNIPKLTQSTFKPFRLDNEIAPILSNAEYYGERIDQQLLWTLSEINRKDLDRLTKIMDKYLRDIGTKTLAKRKLTDVYIEMGQDLPVSKEHIKLLCSDSEFLEMIEPMFLKDTKKAKSLEYSSPQDVVKILYGILEYPITRRDKETKRPKANSEALEDLMSYKAGSPIKFLSGDILSEIVNTELHPSKKERVIIDKDKFESMQYPFAYLLSEWRALYKLRTSFFDSLLAKEKGEYYYTTNSMTSAETGRVINPLQTLIGQLKKLVIPYTDDYYMCVFDMAQIEFRVMIGLAVNYWNAQIEAQESEELKNLLKSRDISYLTTKLTSYEADYHREGGSVFIGTTPEDMTKAQRSAVKAVHFSVPYGAGVFSIAKNDLRKARTPQQEQEAIEKTSLLLGAWQKTMYPLYYFLERKRDIALLPVPEEELPYGKEGKWGKVTNALGRYRWFDLNDLDYKRSASIRRMAGNYPIQSFAREIFFTIINRIYKRLIREGFIVPTDDLPKIILSAFIHDECVMHVHRSINPYVLYKIIYEECMAVKFTNHPPYYMGLAIVNNWYEGKSDKYEAPVDYVDEMVKEFDADPEKFKSQDMFGINARDYVYRDIRKYMTKRYMRELEPYIRRESDGIHVDMDSFMPTFKNYFLKPRLEVHYKEHRKIDKSDEFDGLIALYEEPIILTYPDTPVFIHHSTSKFGPVYEVHEVIGAEECENITKEMPIALEPKEGSGFGVSSGADSGVLGSAETHAFSGNEGESGDMLEVDTPGGDDLADFGFDGLFPEDDDVFGNLESLEDFEELEEMTAREAMLLSEEERSVYIDTDLKLYEDVAKETVKVKTRMYDMGKDRVVIDVTGISTEVFMKLRSYLMENLDAIGRELYFMRGKEMTATHKCINYLVSRDKVDKILGG